MEIEEVYLPIDGQIEKNKENSKITIELKEQHESKPFGKFEFG